MKRAAAFRVCPHSVLGEVRVFVRAVSAEMGKKRRVSGEKVIFVGKVFCSITNLFTPNTYKYIRIHVDTHENSIPQDILFNIHSAE